MSDANGSDQGGGKKRTTKAFLYGALAAVLCSAAAYAAATINAASQLTAARESFTEQKARLEADIKQLRQQEKAAAARSLRLEARRAVSQAIASLDARNFGTASEHLERAAGHLERSQPSGELGEVARELRSTRIEVAEDLEDQRRELLAVLARLDRLVPPPGVSEQPAG